MSMKQPNLNPTSIVDTYNGWVVMDDSTIDAENLCVGQYTKHRLVSDIVMRYGIPGAIGLPKNVYITGSFADSGNIYTSFNTMDPDTLELCRQWCNRVVCDFLDAVYCRG